MKQYNRIFCCYYYYNYYYHFHLRTKYTHVSPLIAKVRVLTVKICSLTLFCILYLYHFCFNVHKFAVNEKSK